MRQLAEIVKILDIQPIEGADAIVVASVLGWKVVIRKDEFKIGDMVVYCQVDSWIPHALAPFLSKGQNPRVYNGVEGEKLRTIRLRGQISQGLILPGIVCPNGLMVKQYNSVMQHIFQEGDDVTEWLGIQKWEAPISAQLAGQIKGNWPDGIPKTDEDRIQGFKSKDVYNLMQYRYEVTEKLEGSSCTMGLINDEFIVCSRNINLKEVEGNTFWTMARKLDIEAKMRFNCLEDMVLQGELIGPGVQKNYYDLPTHEFRVFSCYDLKQGKYLTPMERYAIVHTLQLEHVPVICTEDLKTLCNSSVDKLIQMADFKSVINPKKNREGIVFKRVDGPEHFKVISNEYLLKQKE